MYMPQHFSEADQQRIATLIEANGFATLITTATHGAQNAAQDAAQVGVQISHAPVQYDRARHVLVGHLARANPQAAGLQDGDTMLAVFHGPHGYISPTWYVNENPKSPNVPTWNYAAVHVTGTVRRLDAPEDIWNIVVALSEQYEGGKGAQKWTPGQLAEHAPKLRALVGFEIAITNIQAKFKLSQNRPAGDREGAVAGLEASGFSGDLLLAELMRAYL